MVPICTVRFKIHKSYVLAAKYISSFCTDLATSFISLDRTDWFI